MRLTLRKVLSDIPFVNLVGEADNGDDGFQLIVNLKPHVAFLDVQMPGIDGVKIGKLVSELNKAGTQETFVVFATAYAEFSLDAFECYAFDFLIKPYNIERIRETLYRIKDHFTGTVKPKKILVKKDSGMFIVDPNDITFITKEGGFSYIYFSNKKKVKVNETLVYFEKNLDSKIFIRCCKSYIVNVMKIKEIKPFSRKAYALSFEDTAETALASKDKLKEIEKILGSLNKAYASPA